MSLVSNNNDNNTYNKTNYEYKLLIIMITHNNNDNNTENKTNTSCSYTPKISIKSIINYTSTRVVFFYKYTICSLNNGWKFTKTNYIK
jgi:hypothetical protein